MIKSTDYSAFESAESGSSVEEEVSTHPQRTFSPLHMFKLLLAFTRHSYRFNSEISPKLSTVLAETLRPIVSKLSSQIIENTSRKAASIRLFDITASSRVGLEQNISNDLARI